MQKCILKLQYGTKQVINLKHTWIQSMTMSPGYMLCYEDDIYNRQIIYISLDKKLLKSIQNIFMQKYNEGKEIIYL